jgi:hypothetical protein
MKVMTILRKKGIRVTEHPTAGWAAQQILERRGWGREPPRFLLHDRDSRYGALFDRRLQSMGITQIRLPFRAVGRQIQIPASLKHDN